MIPKCDAFIWRGRNVTLLGKNQFKLVVDKSNVIVCNSIECTRAHNLRSCLLPHGEKRQHKACNVPYKYDHY